MRALPGLGDLLCAIPAWRALRAAYQEAEITLVGLPTAQPLVARFNCYLDGLLELPGYPGLPEQPFEPTRFLDFLQTCYSNRFDLVIQMHGSGLVSNPLAVMLGARSNAGFYLPGQYCPDATSFLAYPAHEPEVRRHLRLMEFLDVPLRGEDLEFPITSNEEERFEKLPEAAALRTTSYACLHPGASIAARRWSPEHFAAVGDTLYALGLQVVITGTSGELELSQRLSRAMRVPHYNFTGRTDLGTLAVLLKRARLLVANDTGVSHLGVALRVPSVVIFTGSDPDRWGPLDQERHRIVVSATAEVNPCHHPISENCNRCLRDGCVNHKQARRSARNNEVTVEAVLDQVRELLREEKPNAA